MGAKIQRPTKCRAVLFTAARGQGDNEHVVDEYAATVVDVNPEKPSEVKLVTFGNGSLYFQDKNWVPYSAEARAGTWRYPPIVKDEIEVD